MFPEGEKDDLEWSYFSRPSRQQKDCNISDVSEVHSTFNSSRSEL